MIRLILLQVALLFGVLAGLVIGGAQSAAQQQPVTLSGTLEMGTPDIALNPADVTLTMRTLEGIDVVDQRSAQADAAGNFAFGNILPQEGRTYFVTAEYQGAVYSASATPESLSQSLRVIVYAATNSTEDIFFTNHTMIITGADTKLEVVEVLERITIANRGARTLVPDTSTPGVMGFLRFALPTGATNLDIQSTLIGGTTIQVDRGFALTSPVPPTPNELYEVQFIYRVPYHGQALDLSRNLTFGAKPMRIVIPTNVGKLVSPTLNDLGSVNLEGKDYQLLEGEELAKGSRLELSIEGLPQPTIWQRLTRFAGSWYTRAVIPAVAVLVLAGALIYGMSRREAAVSVVSAEEIALTKAHLLARLEAIGSAHQHGVVSRRRYEQERNLIRQALIDLEMKSRLGQFSKPVTHSEP